ncbi:MAG: feruloyl-CoA synthase [Minwuia thermotolerans]|nr:MAG: feruloyl-CoA synthase [Minwuia thermotolerans]
MTDVTLNGLRFLAQRAELERRDDGAMILRSPVPLGDYPATLGAVLTAQAGANGERTFLAGRDGDGWQTLTYAEVHARAAGIAHHLLTAGLGPERPLMLLSGNSVGHALMTLGAVLAGVPAVPVSPAYSLMSADHAKLRHITDLTRPGLIWVEDAAPFGPALKALAEQGFETVMTSADLAAIQTAGTAPDVDIAPDAVAKILFTSGSTGMPKGVINTHRMLCANQAMLAVAWPFVRDMAPVLVDWLPWNHTFGGNFCFNLALFNGGTFHIDDGKPAPPLIGRTVENLRLASPNLYFNVPAGFAALLPALEQDADLRDCFFRDLKAIFYAAAALPQDLWDRLERVADLSGHPRPLMLSAWGSTETAPLATLVHFSIPRAGNIGLPVPGCELKFQPSGAKYELRLRGPNITPGYHDRPDLTAAAFDEEGFYRMGDAGLLADPDDPSAGVLFDGRVAEDFKLTTGTWVSVGALRVGTVGACSPLVQDVVVTGHDTDRIGLLIWPAMAAVAGLDPEAGDDPEALCASAKVNAAIAEKLAAWNAANPASSTRIDRFVLMAAPPSIDANEITDKGYVNQRATLERRAELVDALRRGTLGTRVPTAE